MSNTNKTKGPLNILMLGAPGSGKGTQAALLAKYFHLKHIDIGDILRQAAKGKTQFSQRLSEVMNRGDLVPTWFVVYNMFNVLSRLKPNKGFITEGNPRLLEEAKILDEIFDWIDRNNTKAIYLKIRLDESKKRMLARRICSRCHHEVSLYLLPDIKDCPVCHSKLISRLDDNPKSINNRFEVFKKDMLPIIAYYKKRGMLLEINGEGPIDEIYKDILNRLNK